MIWHVHYLALAPLAMMCYKTLCTIVASCNFSIIVIISLLSAKHFLTARALDEVKIGESLLSARA